MRTKNEPGVSYKDLEVAFLLEGIPGVERLVRGRRNAARLLSRAAAALQRKGHCAEALEAFIEDRFPRRGQGRDRPGVGGERTYKAQQIDGEVILRLPLASLGVKKRADVVARFANDEIVVVRA